MRNYKMDIITAGFSDIERLKFMLMSQSCVDLREKKDYDLRSILQEIDAEKLDLIYQAEENKKRLDIISSTGKIDAIIQRVNDPGCIRACLPLFAPPILDIFGQACRRRNGVSLNDSCLVSAVAGLHDQTQIIEMSMFQLLGIGFISAKQPDMEDLAETILQGEEVRFDKMDLRFVVPAEVKEICRTLPMDVIERLSDLYYTSDTVAKAASNLYGAISLEDLATVFNQMLRAMRETYGETEKDAEAPDVDEEFFQRALNMHATTQDVYFIDTYRGKDYLLSTALLDDDEAEGDDLAFADYSAHSAGKFAVEHFSECAQPRVQLDSLEEILEQQRGKTWYIPSLEDFLHYEDCAYYEQTEQVRALRNLLKPVCKGYSEHGAHWTAKEQREEILSDVHRCILLSYGVEEQLEVLTDHHIKLERFGEGVDGLNNILDAITDMSNHTRMWENRGWTPNEIKEKYKHKGQSNVPTSLQFGPNVAKTLQSGEMSIDEMRRGIWSMDADAIPTSLRASMLHQLDNIEQRELGKEPGRNDPCPCGSGKKYKHCCGKQK